MTTSRHRLGGSHHRFIGTASLLLGMLAVLGGDAHGEDPEIVAVDLQPLKANARRLIEALEYLGAPLDRATAAAVEQAGDAKSLQRLLDPQVLFVVALNPESRVRVRRGPAQAVLQQAGYTPVVVKVLNDSTVTKPLGVTSPQAGPVYGGVARLSLTRQDQLGLMAEGKAPGKDDRFLQVEMFASPPMTAELSGLPVEYALALIYSSATGRREATIAFDVGQGTQDLGFRGEVPILFDVRPAVAVRLEVRDHDGAPTTARLTFHDRAGRVYPPQPKRLAPDFFFQKQVYRHDGDVVLLPPGELTMLSSRGPEYTLKQERVAVPERGDATLAVRLERWIDPREHGFYGGDHHIHAAGCAHYTSPSEGVHAEDMFLQVQGEGLHVGCILTWGPCFDYQRQFFEPTPNKISESQTLLKYDVEVSGFGSQALGHVCLLNLKDQTYPGSDGTTKGWPTWTTPVLRWSKAQGALTGYAHSASGLAIDAAAAARRLLQQLDADKDGTLRTGETTGERVPLTEDFAAIDADSDGTLTAAELEASHQRVADRLPNLAIPEMNGVGAQEICVTVAEGLCDFISAMDTPRIAEWNCWYHILNCGFPLKVSGETDFPCMSGTRVGQGRVYVQLGKVEAIDFGAWCKGIASGRSYVSDGYAHALEFTVDSQPAGSRLPLAKPGTVTVRAQAAFAAQTPAAVPYGGAVPSGGPRFVGDTVNLHAPDRGGALAAAILPAGSVRLVDVVVNGRAVATQAVPADGAVHALSVAVPIERSSWVALRQFPQLHTNPVDVIVAGRPIRASRASALWCVGVIEQLWRARNRAIAPAERDAARAAFDRAVEQYRKIAAEAPEGS
jgi:hypothetical protein